MTAREVVDARKTRFGRADLPKLFRVGDVVIVSKGKQSVESTVRSGETGWNELAERILGPSGNLRAPTLRIGRTFLVGFHGETWRARLATS